MANNAVSDFVADLVAEIEEGIYDKHLRGIARACYKRRGRLQDGVGVVDEGADALTPTIIENEAESDTDSSTETKTAYEVYQESRYKASAIVVRKGQRVYGSAFRWNGARYWKSHIDGANMYFGKDVAPSRYRNMCVRVTSIYIEGTSKSEVLIVASDRDNSLVGQTITVSRNLLMKRLIELANSNPNPNYI